MSLDGLEVMPHSSIAQILYVAMTKMYTFIARPALNGGIYHTMASVRSPPRSDPTMTHISNVQGKSE